MTISTESSIDPRVARSREAILRATAALLVEEGYSGVTIEGVAERAAVAKTTIYRHWRSRSQLLFDAFESMLQPPAGRRPASDLRSGLVAMLESLIRGVTASPWAPAIASMVEAGDRDEEVRRLVHDFLADRMQPVREVLVEAKAQGTLRPGLDVDASISMLAGAIFYRRLVSRESLNPEFAREVVDLFLAGAGR